MSRFINVHLDVCSPAYVGSHARRGVAEEALGTTAVNVRLHIVSLERDRATL